MKIENFKNEYAFLSNFYDAPVWYNGIMYKNNEAAFQAQKAENPDDRLTFKYLSASAAKSLGRKIKLRSDWEDVKLRVMEEICLAKFTQNADLKKALLATNDAELVEGNTWGDTFWGSVNGKGENNLGKILMKVRDVLKFNFVFNLKSANECVKVFETINNDDRFTIATLEINCLAIELCIERFNNTKITSLYIFNKFFEDNCESWDAVEYESDEDYTELLSTATSKDEIQRFMACKLFKWANNHKDYDILKKSISIATPVCDVPIGESASKLGIAFYADISAADAEEIDKYADFLFEQCQSTLDDFIKALGYEWEMGIVRKKM